MKLSACASVPKSPPGNADSRRWEQRCPYTFAGAWPHSPQWASAQMRDICTNILCQSPSSEEGLLNRSHRISQGLWILQCVRKQTLRPLMWAIIVSMECETFPICEGELGSVYCTNTHKHHVEIINVFMMEICASFIILGFCLDLKQLLRALASAFHFPCYEYVSLLTYS